MKKFAVIGDPIAHSLSPLLHQEIYQQMGIDARYEKMQITTGQLSTFLGRNSLSGFNVTIPHKESVVAFLEKLDGAAETIGAVNCVVGKMGFNTDWTGFLKAMELSGVELKGRACTILGAGGAARAVAYALIQAKVKSISVRNRTEEKARRLEDWMTGLFPQNEPADTMDLIVNCTPVGMWPDNDQMPMELTDIRQDHVLVDTIYNPTETQWLREGRAKGARTVGGLDMFIAQGLASVDIWFQENISDKVDISKIRTKLEAALC